MSGLRELEEIYFRDHPNAAKLPLSLWTRYLAENDFSFQYWLQAIATRSDSTRETYIRCFRPFIEYVAMSPDQLVELKKASEQASDDRRLNQVTEMKVRNYIQDQITRGLKPKTIRTSTSAIQSFFASNQYPLHLTRNDVPIAQGEGSRIPTKIDIRKMLAGARSRKYRALITVMKDSGLRISDIVRLKWSDLVDMGNGFYHFKIVTKKRGIRSLGFFGPEASEALQHVDTNSEFIFNMHRHTITCQISDIASSVGLDDVSAHGLRKFFSVSLQGSGVPRSVVWKLFGKSLSGNEYDENRPEVLFVYYKNHYHSLSIYGVDHSQELSELKERVKNLESMKGVITDYLVTENEEDRRRLLRLLSEEDML